jgi:3-methyladenine DNA glycosylase AlkD
MPAPSRLTKAHVVVKPMINDLIDVTGGQHVPSKERPRSAARPIDVEEVVAMLKRLGSKGVRDGLARFAIPADNALGIPVGVLRDMGKRLGRSHDLAEGLWKAGWLEARMLAVFVDEPALVTPGQMDRWCKDFENWAVCDHACFHLFDRTPHAWRKVDQWARRRAEFEKRAAFALLASLALHDKRAADEPFLERLPLIQGAADDERNFVKKGVNWALRGIGKRNIALRAAATELAQRLAASSSAAARWVGKDALREFAKRGSRRG